MVTAQQSEDIGEANFHPVIKGIAKVIAYLFHPLFIPVYVCWFLIYTVRIFPQLDDWNKTKLLISIVVNYTILPLVTLLLAKGLGFVQSLYLNTQKDRIIPYVASGIFYFWIWYVFKNQQYPNAIISFALAVFLASSAGLLFNSFMKISMHAIAVGVVLMFMVQVGLHASINFGFYISIAVLLCGLVCTARLVTEDHIPIEIYVGLVVGIIAQLVASFFFPM